MEVANAVGVGGYLWTADAADAYLRVPVKKQQWPLLGIRWNGYYFIMTCLPFGLSSSCLLYTLFADSIQWIVLNSNRQIFFTAFNKKTIQLLRHYLDDFFGGHNNKIVAYQQFNTLIQWFNYLNVPTRDSKCSGPSTRQKLLGTIFDTVTQKVYLPPDKCAAYSENIIEILERSKRNSKRIDKKSLESLNGRLRFAARHIWCGEAYCRALEAAINRTKDGGYTRLNKRIKADLRWWLKALNKLGNGISFKYILYPRESCNYTIWTDAYVDGGEAGIGGYNCDGQYFQHHFNLKQIFGDAKPPDINWFEMLAVVVAAHLWGDKYFEDSVHIWSDNAAVVGQISKRSAPFKRPDIKSLIDLLCFDSVEREYHFFIDHIKGEDNKVADALSRFFKQPFQWLSPTQQSNISPIATDCSEIVSHAISCFLN